MTFYFPKELQTNVDVDKTENGKLDAVKMLYSDENIDQYPGWPSTNTDYYNVTTGYFDIKQRMKFTETIKVLLPSAFEDAISAKAGDIIRIRNFDNNYDWTYHTQVRGMIQKMPGFYFSDFSTSLLFQEPSVLISTTQYKNMMDDYG